jgi:hypothetical protein
MGRGEKVLATVPEKFLSSQKIFSHEIIAKI